jgi:uncharacterized protein involved in type VI secretion and phage assembly
MSENGIVPAVVIDLDDPEKLDRVRVRYPHLQDQPSDWARMCASMAGKGRGSHFIPEVGDEVLVALEQGNVRRPYILGALWSAQDTPPPTQGKATDNNLRFIRSRAGHQITLDDTPGKERVVIVDKDNSRQIVLDSANKKIQILCDDGDVEVRAPSGRVDVQAKDVSVKATSSVTVEGLTVEIKASGTLKLEAQGALSLKGATVSVAGDALTEIKGGLVKIN